MFLQMPGMWVEISKLKKMGYYEGTENSQKIPAHGQTFPSRYEAFRHGQLLIQRNKGKKPVPRRKKVVAPGAPITKSLVNGKFVPIARVAAGEKTKLLQQHQLRRTLNRVRPGMAKSPYGALKGVTREDEAFRQTRTAPESKKVIFGGNKVKQRYAEEHGIGAFTTRSGGKSSGTSRVFVNKPMINEVMATKKGRKRTLAHTVAHENAHAVPKRSEYRLHGQIQPNPYKLGREEARADYTAGGHWKSKKNIAEKTPKDLGGGKMPISGYPSMANTERKYIKTMAPEDRPAPKSTFSEGYLGLHNELRAKGVKPKRR